MIVKDVMKFSNKAEVKKEGEMKTDIVGEFGKLADSK